MFLDLNKKDPASLAVIDDSGQALTYGDICSFSAQFAQHVPARSLIFLLTENRNGSLLGYVACLSNGIVPLLLNAKTEEGAYRNLFDLYRPAYVWASEDNKQCAGLKPVFAANGYALYPTGNEPVSMHPDLALLLLTSGSTGSPKLVRHSLRNVEVNAENVRQLFGLTADERAMAILPMYYTMGLSVITSHLLAGATVLLSGRSMLDKGFWATLREATSFTGVPYSYELLMRMRFMRMDLPNLRVLSQGGGKLTEEMFRALAQYAHDTGKRFIATYGQSECTARMAYLPAELALEKTCSIGFAEPGGQLSLVDENGHESFTGEATGELVYRGENVTLGYAFGPEDLTKGDENHGVMHTGDLARRDADGCYFIVGRLKRFLKIYGIRVDLEELENLIQSTFKTDCYCKGDDEKLVVLVADRQVAAQLPAFLENKTHLFHKNLEIRLVDEILRNEAGKVINQ
jgi:acyl-coenzyme A synthetase/AMP-(fatty) acid ligase